MGWNSAVQFVFYGLAVLLGFVIVALIIFSCSKLINMPNISSTSHHHITEKPKQAMNTSMAIHVEPQIVVIMAGDEKPTYLATPVLRPIQHSDEQVIKKGLNSTFLTLIPKIPNPSSLSDYRPISLLGCIYKVLAKVLSSRLKSVLPKLIDETQSAFVKGRQILDGILIANEVVDLWKRNSLGGLLLKLDFQKAFDSVNWNFLFHILQNFGFGEKWISWVKECVSSPHISVLVNGSPSQEFPPQRGLRQGDHLSPFLFNLVVERLNILIQRAKNLNLIKGVDIGGSGLNLSHLQFADDTLMFCNPDWDEIINLKRILSCFELISGLKINYQKSVICGVGVNRDFTSQVVEFFNCRVSSLPINYLGMPLGANPKRVSTWEPIINKVKKRIVSWKKRYLSLGGRITLIKSVLSSLPIYYMSLFKIPTQVANLIEKYQRSFLWGDSDVKRKLHLLNWEACSVSKHFRGLGFRKTKEGNDTLLCKWWWRFATEKSSLWRKVLCAKNNVNEDCWLPNGSSFRFSSAMWKSISTMERRTLRAWEDELHLELISRLPQPLSINNNCVDHLLWTPFPSGSFTVKSLYEIFENSLRLTAFPIMKMWKSAAPPKIKAFGWLVWWNRIASSDLLARRLIIPAINHCAFCGIDNESALHCNFTWKVWAEIFCWWGSQWVSPSSLQDLLLWWYGQKYKNLGKLIWEVIPLAVVWSLWIARNNMVFNSKVPVWGNIVDSIKIKVATWVKFSSHLPNYTIHDFMHCLDGLKGHKL
ncbi:uncharacterized protein LOC114306978 [Camellia sinensis]|uniref:uncharacterized protein LOC114306978 n=1 Tax=Camellia sinensis TaxID=4442 RepID=UPI0010361305|nr:uncharacterized protein LOC114306978 [Camellia sinensis]